MYRIQCRTRSPFCLPHYLCNGNISALSLPDCWQCHSVFFMIQLIIFGLNVPGREVESLFICIWKIPRKKCEREAGGEADFVICQLRAESWPHWGGWVSEASGERQMGFWVFIVSLPPTSISLSLSFIFNIILYQHSGIIFSRLSKNSQQNIFHAPVKWPSFKLNEKKSCEECAIWGSDGSDALLLITQCKAGPRRVTPLYEPPDEIARCSRVRP